MGIRIDYIFVSTNIVNNININHKIDAGTLYNSDHCSILITQKDRIHTGRNNYKYYDSSLLERRYVQNKILIKVKKNLINFLYDIREVNSKKELEEKDISEIEKKLPEEIINIKLINQFITNTAIKVLIDEGKKIKMSRDSKITKEKERFKTIFEDTSRSTKLTFDKTCFQLPEATGYELVDLICSYNSNV